MISLKEYINESLNAFDTLMDAFKNAKENNALSKQTVTSMLSSLSIKDLKKLSDELKKEYESYSAYDPNSDLFLSQNNFDSIVDVMGNFILKEDI